MTDQEIIPVGKPEMTKGIGSYTFSWADLGVTIRADRLTDDGTGELTFNHQNGTGDTRTLHICRANLMSTTMTGSLAKRLVGNLNIDWQTALTYVTRDVLIDLRKGAPTEDIGQEVEDMEIKYLLWPFIQEGQPTTIFGAGESAKTLCAQLMALSVQSGLPVLNWRPVKGNALYLDWEAQSTDHHRRAWAIKVGMGFLADTMFAYQWHDHPLVDIADSVRKTIETRAISLVIVDSQMAAMGRATHGRSEADLSAEYYGCLRSFGCATLTIDHINKMDWKTAGGETGPYGSVVKFNRSRIQFEVRKKQEVGQPYLDLTIIQRKINEGMHLPDQGIRINFDNSDDGNLSGISFETIAVDTKGGREPTIADLCYDAIRRAGPQSVAVLKVYLDKDEDTIRKSLKREPNRFIYKDGNWGIIS